MRVWLAREHELEPRSVRLHLVVEEVAALSLRVRLGNRQAQARSLRALAPRRVAPREALEELRDELGWDTVPVVDDVEPEVAVTLLRRDLDRGRTLSGR